MNLNYNIFAISQVVFESKQEDPFGVDAYSEKIAEKYIKFSGSIRNPIYLLFVAYINQLFKEKHIEYKNNREKNEIKARMEKLFVTSLKHGNKNLKSKNIIGNSIRRINPFMGNDGNWVVVNSYRIYEAPARILIPEDLIIKYHEGNKKEIGLIKNFLKRIGALDHNQRYLNDLVKNFRKIGKKSLFSGNLLLSRNYRAMLLKSLKDVINKGGFGEDKELIRGIFKKPAKADRVLYELLDKKGKYPFCSMNDWFSSFILAVNADLERKDSRAYWEKADKLYDLLKKKHHNIPIDNRPKTNAWFTLENNGYKKTNSFDESKWNALLKRAKRPDRRVFNFRIEALISILKELDPNAK